MGKTERGQPRLTFEPRRAGRNAQQTASDSEADAPTDRLTNIDKTLLAVQASLLAIDGKIDKLNLRMDHMSSKLDKQAQSLGEAETRIADTEEGLQTAADKTSSMEKILAVIQAHNEDLEARSRRNNVRITGLPDSTNTARLETYVEDLLRDIFGAENFSPVLIVERAHRSLAARPAPGMTPRPIIARLLNYRDRDTVLRLAREKGAITHQGNQLAFYPDFTMAVQEARRAYQSTKKLLLAAKVPYAMLYPARLRVETNGRFKIFTCPKAALEFARSLAKRDRSLPVETHGAEGNSGTDATVRTAD